MKSFLLSNLSIGILFIATAHAGGISDGGGNSVVCRNTAKQITSAILLDLYEATKLHKLQLVKNDSSRDYLEIALEAAKKIDSGGGGHDVTYTSRTQINGVATGPVSFGILPSMSTRSLEILVTNIFGSFNLVSDASLTPIDDYKTLLIPKNCQIEQTAIYIDETNEVHIVEEIWNALDNTNKAALLVHEAVYKNMRISGEDNSNRTRNAVGHAFTTEIFPNILDGVPNNVLVCGTEDNSPKYIFAVYEETPGIATFQFFWLNNKIMLSKTTLKVDKPTSPLSQHGGLNSTLAANLNESILEKKLTLIVAKEEVAPNVFESSIGIAVNMITDKDLFKVTCNQAHFKCDSQGCSSWLERKLP